ncbi:unnamed protein product [Caenorhabditis sp. 36 PRJEB53466]|nr:unnamed protein product [Caenorhabditis sp. 36 PRJEB53466]
MADSAQKRPSERTAEPKTKQRKVCDVESEQVQVQQEQQAPSEVSSNAPFQMNPFEQNDPEGDNVEWVQIEEDEVVPEDQEEDNVEWVQIEEDQVMPEDQEGDNVTWVQVPEDQVFYDYLPVEQQEVGDNVPLQQYPSENNGTHGQQVLIQEQIEDEQLMREFFYSPEQQQWNNQVENVENVNNWHVEHQYQQHHNGFQGQNGNVENQRMPTAPGTNGQWNPEPRQPHY